MNRLARRDPTRLPAAAPTAHAAACAGVSIDYKASLGWAVKHENTPVFRVNKATRWFRIS